VAEYTLHAQSPLRGFNRRFGNTHLRELVDTAIYSISLALVAEPALRSIKSNLGAQWPSTGNSTISTDGKFRLLGLQSDQVFVLMSEPSAQDGQAAKLPNLDNTAYITDQSDSWAGMSIEGESATLALERICPIDLHPSTFGVGQVTRTTMEHLAVIILREADNRYLLMSPSSSASSFQHALETSLHNVIE